MVLRVIVSLTILFSCLFANAQANEERAKQLLDFCMVGQGDSVYVRLNDNVRSNLTPAVFNQIFLGLEQQVGKYQSHSEWKTELVNNMKIYYTDLQFENLALRFLTAFDDDGLANTIRFMPVPAKPTAKAELLNTEEIEEKEIEIISGQLKLPGILSLPKGVTRPPVAILVHGSGPNDRDETIGPNKPFRDLAYGLAKQGIAVVRYDKRTYVYKDVELASDFDKETVDDALAIIEMMKNEPLIDSNRIYIVGHSQGALLAPRIAERSRNALAGIILIAGPARSMEDLMVEQTIYLSSLAPSTPETEKQVEAIKQQAINVKKIGREPFDEKNGLILEVPISYWKFANEYRPVEVAKKLKLPMLIVQGERDYQVTMEDFNLWKAGLAKAKYVSFKSYSKLNHLLQEGIGKSTPTEYNVQTPVAEYLISDIANWIKEN
ncbi:alpha/beta fold hydrolase [Bacteroides sp. 224]|uniref:alpha/beta hydrolase n=1 Tax=Bacteroides sp. 224 TaxID=2302936 RepID=UPI0013D264E0|nr:alpha/beta fold hydrolase [Bacteroides sp. 224]NDV65961.1 alpha/beta fold hydrolase [Bacteroides sp. 224]